MQTFDVEVTQTIRISLDETKFTEHFMQEFRDLIFPAYDTRDHAEHLASLYARGVIEGYGSEFVEGYGPISEFGVEIELLGENTNVID